MSSTDALRKRIARLEIELQESQQQLRSANAGGQLQSERTDTAAQSDIVESDAQRIDASPTLTDEQHGETSRASMPMSNLHSLLIITDSALPLGSFAFSSGLESLLAHQPKIPKQSVLRHFLLHSLASVARLAVPYLLKAHKEPAALLDTDNDFDASTPCTVARRASIAQGRALLTNWERALRFHASSSEATRALTRLSSELRVPTDTTFEVCAHLPPVFGVVSAALELDAYLAAYAFLLNHVKAVLSAAIRASVLGPFQAQAVLSSGWLREEVNRHALGAGRISVEDAGQVWVPGDLWIGRHELLYSRIFNS